MGGYSRRSIRRWVDDVLPHARSHVLGDEDEVYKLGDGVTLEAGDNDNLSTRSEEEIVFVDGSGDDTQSTESASVAGSTPTEPETTAEHPTFTQPLPPPATFTIRTMTASAQPQPLTTLTPITHSARPLPTTTRDNNDDPGKTKDRDRNGKHEKTDSASVTDGFMTVTTFHNSTIAITSPTPTAVFASATSSVLISATASPAINDGAALQGAQQKGTSSGHMSGGAKAGIAIGVAAGVSMLAIVLFWLIKCFCSRKSEANTESSIRAFLSGGKSGPGDGGLPPPATAAGAGAGQLSSNFDPRSNSQILDELIAASYAHQNGQDSSIPNGYVLPDPTALDEKQADGAYPVTIIQPAPTHQPEIRKSVASWLRKHHPLKLSPLSIRGSTFSAFSSRRASSAYSSSQQGGGGGGGARDSLVSDYPSPTSYDPDAPPLPEIPATYFNEIPKPLSPMPKKLPTAAANMKAMKFQSVWSDSSAGTDMNPSRMTVSTEGNESLFNLYEGDDGQVRVPSQVVTSLSPPPPLMNKDQDQGKDQGQGQRASSPTLRP